MGKIIRNTLILTIITVVAGLGLGLVYEVTKEPIARTEEQAKKEAWQTVFSDVSLEDFKAVDVDKEAADKTAADLGIKATVDEVCEAADEGYVVTVTDKEGYGGDISFMMGIRMDGTLNGISILSISETAGLGMNAKTDAFRNQFKDKNVEQFTLTKTGSTADSEIDALSGATITSTAMVNGVNAGLAAFSSLGGAK